MRPCRRRPSSFTRWACLALLSATSCSHEDPPTSPPPPFISTPIPGIVYLSAPEQLSRASIALRGFRPSVEDLRAVEQDPTSLRAFVDAYLASSDFGATVRDLHNDAFLTDTESGKFVYSNEGPLSSSNFTDLRGVLQAPQRLAEYIVMQGRPYTELVTADYLVANGTVAAAWGLAHQGPAEEWEKTQWADDRPAAGMLSSTIFYQRHVSAGSNFNRGRANAISTALLCHDFLDSDIVIDTKVNLADDNAVAEAVVANPSCAGCHQTLDPLASYFFAFPSRYPNTITAKYLPYTGYNPSLVDDWQTTNERPPGFFGDHPADLGDLGKAIADDPRFARCTVQRFASYFTQVPRDALPGAWVARLQHDFVAGGFDARALARAIVLSPEFQVAYTQDAGAADAVVGLLKMRPRVFSRTLRELTGFTWMVELPGAKLSGVPLGPVDLLDDDSLGYRVLGGGMDGFYVTQAMTTTGATASLVTRRAAQAAADALVEHDAAAEPADRRLFLAASVDATSEPAVRAELAYLHARIYGERVDPTASQIDDSYQLYRDALAAHADPRRAWKITLSGLLGDLRSLYY